MTLLVAYLFLATTSTKTALVLFVTYLAGDGLGALAGIWLSPCSDLINAINCTI